MNLDAFYESHEEYNFRKRNDQDLAIVEHGRYSYHYARVWCIIRAAKHHESVFDVLIRKQPVTTLEELSIPRTALYSQSFLEW